MQGLLVSSHSHHSDPLLPGAPRTPGPPGQQSVISQLSVSHQSAISQSSVSQSSVSQSSVNHQTLISQSVRIKTQALEASLPASVLPQELAACKASWSVVSVIRQSSDSQS